MSMNGFRETTANVASLLQLWICSVCIIQTMTERVNVKEKKKKKVFLIHSHTNKQTWCTYRLHQIHGGRFFKKRIKCYAPCFLPSCQNLAPTLPIIQFNQRQFSRRFRCVILVAADVLGAASHKQVWGHTSRFLYFQTCSQCPKNDTAKWHHFRRFIRISAAPSEAT